MRENEAEEIFGEIMTKKCPKLMTETLPRSKKSRENQPSLYMLFLLQEIPGIDLVYLYKTLSKI